MARSYNIKFPLRDDSVKNKYLQMTQITKDALGSNLLLLLLTQKGERYYEPDYGTNLLKYIFEPNDDVTIQDVRNDIEDAVNKFIPGLRIDELNVEFDKENEHKITVKVNFTITDGVFESSDYVEITF